MGSTSSLRPGRGHRPCLCLLTLEAKGLGRAIWGWRWASGSPCCDRGQAGGAASVTLPRGQAVGQAAQSLGGPAPKGQLWGAELPREARVWAKGSDLSYASGSRAELTDGDEQGQGDPPWGSQQSPLLIQLWGWHHPHPCRVPVPETAPPWPRLVTLTSFSLRHGGAGALLLLPPLPPGCPAPSRLRGRRQDSHVGREFWLRRFHLGAEGHRALAGGSCRLPGRGARGLGSGSCRGGAAGLSQRS